MVHHTARLGGIYDFFSHACVTDGDYVEAGEGLIFDTFQNIPKTSSPERGVLRFPATSEEISFRLRIILKTLGFLTCVRQYIEAL